MNQKKTRAKKKNVSLRLFNSMTYIKIYMRKAITSWGKHYYRKARTQSAQVRELQGEFVCGFSGNAVWNDVVRHVFVVSVYGIFSLLDRHHSPLWQSKSADACNCNFSRFSWSGCHKRIIICVRIIWREFISTLRKPANSPRCLLENWKFIVFFTKLHCGLYLGRARTRNRSIFKATDFYVKKCLLEDAWDVVALSRLRL